MPTTEISSPYDHDITDQPTTVYHTVTTSTEEDDSYDYDNDDDSYDYYNDDEYAEYRDDVNDNLSDYYDEEEDEEFPDEKTLSPDVRIRYEIDRLIGEMQDENDLHEHGHLFEILIKNCTWKGVDCKTG